MNGMNWRDRSFTPGRYQRASSGMLFKKTTAHMIRSLNKQFRVLTRWIRKQRRGRFAQSTVLTLITRPLWQHERITAWMGAPLMAAVVAGSTLTQMPTTDSLASWSVGQPTSNIPGYTTEMKTEHTYILPVVQLTGISQYYHAGHPGIDFRAPLGTAVVAMDNGTVNSITEQKTGYGRHIYVSSDDGKVSLYAHLGLIMVEVGDRINAGDKIAEIGLTGWTTGPHLHFEVMENGVKTNPMALLSKSINQYSSVASR